MHLEYNISNVSLESKQRDLQTVTPKAESCLENPPGTQDAGPRRIWILVAVDVVVCATGLSYPEQAYVPLIVNNHRR